MDDVFGASDPQLFRHPILSAVSALVQLFWVPLFVRS
jgi:hypothetical protein